MAAGPMKGIRVLDLTQMLAGPACTQLLGDLGADVVKVEPPWGERQRRGPARIDDTETYTFMGANRNKRSVCIDLGTEEGLELVLRLVESADVFIHNYRQPSIERLGLSYEALRSANPRLVYASVSGFEDKGAFKDLPGQDLQVQAFGGMVSVTGYPDETRPSPPAGSTITDQAAGALTAFGVVAALYERERTGAGREVKTSLMAAALFLQEPLFTTYLITGELPRKAGNGHPLSPPPQGIWRGSDGGEFAITGAYDEENWRDFCAIIRRPELADDPRFATVEYRLANADDLFVLVQEALAEEPRHKWVQIFRTAGLWSVPVRDYEEICSTPHLRDNDLLVDMSHPLLGDFSALNTPLHFDDTRAVANRPPPLLGEHTREVLADMGYGSEAIDALEASGIVGRRDQSGPG